jgi:hypothetical protein
MASLRPYRAASAARRSYCPPHGAHRSATAAPFGSGHFGVGVRTNSMKAMPLRSARLYTSRRSPNVLNSWRSASVVTSAASPRQKSERDGCSRSGGGWSGLPAAARRDTHAHVRRLSVGRVHESRHVPMGGRGGRRSCAGGRKGRPSRAGMNPGPVLTDAAAVGQSRLVPPPPRRIVPNERTWPGCKGGVERQRLWPWERRQQRRTRVPGPRRRRSRQPKARRCRQQVERGRPPPRGRQCHRRHACALQGPPQGRLQRARRRRPRIRVEAHSSSRESDDGRRQPPRQL